MCRTIGIRRNVGVGKIDAMKKGVATYTLALVSRNYDIASSSFTSEIAAEGLIHESSGYPPTNWSERQP